jgi:toxin CcdB
VPQFDVHRNPGRQRESIPFVVVVQSSQFEGYRRRLVVPLVKASSVDGRALKSLNPAFTIRNVRVVLHPLDLTSVPVEQLGECVGSLAESADVIVAALDEVLTRVWK